MPDLALPFLSAHISRDARGTVAWFRLGTKGPGLIAKTTPTLFSERMGGCKPLAKVGTLRVLRLGAVRSTPSAK